MKKFKVGNIRFGFQYNYDDYFKDNIEQYEIDNLENINHKIKVNITNNITHPKGNIIGNSNPFIIMNKDKKIIFYKDDKDVKILIEHDYQFNNVIINLNKKIIKDLVETEYILSGVMFLELSMYKGYLPIHATALKINNELVLFSGPSGIGKSTHRSLWLETYKDVLIINDDKPILDFSDPNNIYVLGSPFSGEHKINFNTKGPLKAIVLLKQGLNNDIKVLDKNKIIPELIRNILRPQTEELWNDILPLIERIYETIPVITITATKDKNAVKAIYKYLFEDK